MILSEYVFICLKFNSNIIKYYVDKGYIFNKNDEFRIKVEDLHKNSSIKVDVKCDICESEKKLTYSKYIKNVSNGGFYSCSQKCSIEKKKKTFLENYGVENPSQSNIIKDKKKKTFLERYGVENIMFLEETKDKIKKTNLEKYGVENIIFLEETKDKIKKTNLERYGNICTWKSLKLKEKSDNRKMERYGTLYPMQTEEIKEKTKKTNLERYGVSTPLKKESSINIIKTKRINKCTDYYKNLFYNNNEYDFLYYKKRNFKFIHTICGNTFSISHSRYTYRFDSKIPLCTICHPISENKSIKEKELITFIKSFDLEVKENDKTVLNPKHLDIYIPEYNLAIEFNGLYWHSEKFKDKNYHLDKSIRCLEKGIDLLHIWEDEWVFKQDIVKSIISNRLNKNEKIYARKCVVKSVDKLVVKDFLESNHIDGYVKSNINIGLYYNNELVCLMCLKKKDNNFEIVRTCTKLNYSVVGGISKLFNYFKKNYRFNQITTSTDFRLFNGNVYEKLGFVKQKLSKPKFYWCDRTNRMKKKKDNYYKLYDSGEVIWKLF